MAPIVYTEADGHIRGPLVWLGFFLSPGVGMADKGGMATDISTILKLTVPVIVELGRHRMAMDDVLALGPGAILELEKPSEDELDLLVNNVPMGKGVAVKVGENFGIRITAIGSAKQRVEALAARDE